MGCHGRGPLGQDRMGQDKTEGMAWEEIKQRGWDRMG